jgi:hypothetical protein
VTTVHHLPHHVEQQTRTVLADALGKASELIAEAQAALEKSANSTEEFTEIHEKLRRVRDGLSSALIVTRSWTKKRTRKNPA